MLMPRWDKLREVLAASVITTEPMLMVSGDVLHEISTASILTSCHFPLHQFVLLWGA